MELDKDKLEVQKQWDTDPCAANTVQDQVPESLEYYRAIRYHRYNEYGPWFDDVVKFEQWKDKDVLEIGVGLGSDHYRFASNNNRMTALDLSREHLRHTKKHLELEGLSTESVYGDAENIPFEDNKFDLVYSFGVLHHTPGTEQAIDEIYRVLKPGGQAIVGLYHRDSYFYWLRTMFVLGILQGKLWTKGKRRLLSEIEYRQDQLSAIPLVKVYSRKQTKKMFSRYSEVKLTVCHVDPGRIGKHMKGCCC